jgi:predicted ribosomally synthesized peptide with SipW-like signal peptide
MSNSSNNNKKRAVATIAAVVIAVCAVFGGGTFAYLQAETEDVTNNFETNKVLVSLAETTGTEYDIIPGTSQEKDPVVTVDNTIDSYVYVTVIDQTDGNVTYEIADGWTKLGGDDSNIYYREVAGDADVKSFSVLKNDEVTYDASLVNSDMVDGNGALKEGLELTFSASAVQKAPWNDPIQAYYQSDVTVSSYDELAEEIADMESGTIVLTDDIDTTESIEIAEDQQITLALAGNTITNTTDNAIVVDDGALVEIVDGTVDATANVKAALVNNVGGTVTLENVTLTRSEEAGTYDSSTGTTSANGNSYYVLVNHGDMTINEGTTVIADGGASSLIENGWYNPNDNTTGADSTLVINGGYFEGGLNVIKNDDYGVLTINDGTFIGNAQNVLVNCATATATINGGNFVNNGKNNLVYSKNTITVNGGNFSESSKKYIIGVASGTATITGGTYNSVYISNKAVASGYQKVNNGDGTYSVVKIASTED